MTVHNLAEYVKYHQEKLRQQDAASQSSQYTTSAPKKSRGVNQLHSKHSFNTSVVEASKSGKIVVIDYFATWCGPCKVIAPKIVEMSQEAKYSDKVDFVKIDVDQVSDVAAEQGIRAMPTFAIFKDGEKVDEVVGANERAIRSALDKLVA
ncbi:thioredoxin trx1 [Neophaeococcomyces mojaviensis]|uniref:Thioredoxin trx1 n=1 Tax=Neophaeococcomyces mojaviensis TaxID=3383035 RepID=A0ACC3A2I9_9EURO|nr:thioredoxin trx1 [Knufia sp. JES_112]